MIERSQNLSTLQEVESITFSNSKVKLSGSSIGKEKPWFAEKKDNQLSKRISSSMHTELTLRSSKTLSELLKNTASIKTTRVSASMKFTDGVSTGARFNRSNADL